MLCFTHFSHPIFSANCINLLKFKMQEAALPFISCLQQTRAIDSLPTPKFSEPWAHAISSAEFTAEERHFCSSDILLFAPTPCVWPNSTVLRYSGLHWSKKIYLEPLTFFSHTHTDDPRFVFCYRDRHKQTAKR